MADWDLTAYFPALRGPEYLAFRDALARDVAALRERVAALGPIDVDCTERWAALLVELEQAEARSQYLSSYLGCASAADARDATVRTERASASAAAARLTQLWVAVRAALGQASDAEFEALVAHPDLNGAGHYLGRQRQRARRSMEPALEELGAELAVDGLLAWGRLYDQVSGSLEFDLAEPGGESRRLPVALTRSYLEDPDPRVRRAAFDGSARAWESVADVTAACLNAISGTRLTLYARRGVGHFLEPALFDAAISRETLDAMLGAVEARRGVPERYLRCKARLMGRERLGFEDLLAPLPMAEAPRIPWEQARARVEGCFTRAYPALGRVAERAFESRWIDHTPRPGKRPGGFCTSPALLGESRVFLNYGGAPGDVATLAHELGHAFHGATLHGVRPWARRYPLTLAETASTFAEQLVLDAVLDDPDAGPEDALRVLDLRLRDASVFLQNIPMRFAFEHRVYEERASGELSVERLKALMLEAQREWYGDALDPERLDPWYWASKLHFFLTDVSFYNFPYTFGYLFSLGLFERGKREGAAFLPRYEALLRATGLDTAERVVAGVLGADLTDPAFWHASIDVLEANLERFEALCARLCARGWKEPAGAPA